MGLGNLRRTEHTEIAPPVDKELERKARQKLEGCIFLAYL